MVVGIIINDINDGNNDVAYMLVLEAQIMIFLR